MLDGVIYLDLAGGLTDVLILKEKLFDSGS